MVAAGDRGAAARAHRAWRMPLGIVIAMGCLPPGAGASILEAGDGRQAAGWLQTGPAAAADAFGDIFTPAEREPVSSPALAASERGLAAVAEALRGDAAIKEMLRDILPPVTPAQLARDLDERGDPVQFQVADAADTKSAPAAPRARRGPTRDGDTEDAATETDDNGALTLRQVLHAIATPAQTDRARTHGTVDDQDGDDEEAGPSLDLTSRLLDSRILGEAMEHIVEVDSVDNSFSIFGVGRFELQIGGADHSFVVTDLGSNLSLDLSPTPSPDAGPREPRAAAVKINLLALALSFLESPTGVMASIFSGTLLLLWGAVRLAARLRS